MKTKILLLTIIISFGFTGKMWVAYDFSWDVELSAYGDSYGDDADSGALIIGYESSVSNNISYGASYDIIGAAFDDYYSGWDAQMINLYAKYHMPINDDMSGWASLGYSIPTGDFDFVDSGLSYGFGVSQPSGLGFYYIINNLESSEMMYGYYGYYDVNVDVTVTRMGLSYSF